MPTNFYGNYSNTSAILTIEDLEIAIYVANLKPVPEELISRRDAKRKQYEIINEFQNMYELVPDENFV